MIRDMMSITTSPENLYVLLYSRMYDDYLRCHLLSKREFEHAVEMNIQQNKAEVMPGLMINVYRPSSHAVHVVPHHWLYINMPGTTG